jgi:hypothetical protein
VVEGTGLEILLGPCRFVLPDINSSRIIRQPDMLQVPLRTRVILNTTLLVADEVGEGSAKAIKTLSVTNLDTETSKHAAQLLIGKESLDASPELAMRLLGAAFPEALNRSKDGYLIGKLQAEEVVETSSPDPNPSPSIMFGVVEELLNTIQTGENSKLYLFGPPRLVKALSRAAYESGISTLKYNGGELFGVKVVASAAMPAGRLTIADASAIVYGEDGIEIKSSETAAVEASTTPTGSSASPTAVSLVSCFQTNTRALLVEQRIAVRVVDTNAVATVSGLLWGSSTDSPQMP